MNQLLLHRWTQYFNSQPHEEADECLVTPLVEMLHFNSQPHEEADMLLNFIKLLVFYFNSQPHEEADEDNNVDNRTDEIFQLTASRRG